jgi:hypothetical protein
MGLKLGPQRSAYVLHTQHEVKWVGGAGLELGYEMTAEVAGFGGFGVHQDASTADVVGEVNQAKDILEHSGPESCTFVVGVHTESSEQAYWLRIAPSTHPAGDRLRVQLGHTPGVIGDDSMVLVLGDDEDSCPAGRA